MTDGQRFLVELRDAPGGRYGEPSPDVPVYRRLAQVLKRLGRTYGFKAESVVEIASGASEVAPSGTAAEKTAQTEAEFAPPKESRDA